jgi:hypothetical protein
LDTFQHFQQLRILLSDERSDFVQPSLRGDLGALQGSNVVQSCSQV